MKENKRIFDDPVVIGCIMTICPLLAFILVAISKKLKKVERATLLSVSALFTIFYAYILINFLIVRL